MKITYLYTAAFLCLLIKGLIFSLGFPEALLAGILVCLHGYELYLNNKEKPDANKEIREDLDKLSNLVQTTLMIKQMKRQ
jgi:hypothetical protein